ncbi:MAG: DUF1573 domain-containing protein [Phycisphaerales bacterium]|nr:MAG: DUF1573 domain-containing protein [Phycisphaerales bacterium]
MKLYRAVAVCAVLLAGAALCHAESPQTGVGNDSPFRIDPKAIDFGQVVRGQTPQSRIRLINVSERTVTVRRVKTECECIGLALDGPTEMQPGGVLEVDLNYATMREPAGETTKKLIFEYEDGGEKRFEFDVSIDIVPGVAFEPAFLSFGRLRVGEARTMPLLLETPDEVDFAVAKAETSDDMISTDYSRKEHARMSPQHQIDVTVGPFTEPGRFSGTVVLHTQHWSDTELEVPVFAEVIGKVTVEPTTIYRGKAKRGEVVTEALKLEGWPGDVSDLRIRAESDTMSALKPELVQAEVSGNGVVLRLTIPEDVSGNTINGKLALYGSEEKEPLARLTVFVYLPPSEANP